MHHMLIKVTTTMTMKAMSAINVITMIVKSVKGVSNMKLDYAIITNYILMTIGSILLVNNIATMNNKMLLALTWMMIQAKTTTERKMTT